MNTKINIRALLILLIAALALFIAQEPEKASSQDITRTFRQLMPGCKYYSIYRDKGPYSINIIKAEYKRNRYLSMGTVLSDDKLLKLGTVSNKAKDLQTNNKLKPVVGINGDFYHGAPLYGAPLGVTIKDREIVSIPNKNHKSRPTFYIDTNNKPNIEKLHFDIRVRGSNWKNHLSVNAVNQVRSSGSVVVFTPILGTSTKTGSSGVEIIARDVVGVKPGERFMFLPGRIYQARVSEVRDGVGNSTIPDSGFVISASGNAAAQLRTIKPGSSVYLEAREENRSRSDILHALSGWPIILEDGVNLGERYGDERHPRTAIGFNGDEIIVAVVDGRQPGISIGMTLEELGRLMKEQGATHAINLDGGGSTTMWTRSMGVVNKPSDGRERRIGTSFFLFSTAPIGPLTYIVPEPDDLSIFASENYQISVMGEDKHHNPVEFDSSQITWKNDREIGKVSQYGFFSAGSKQATGFINLDMGKMKSRIKVNVYKTPPYLRLFPRDIVLEKGKPYSFKLLAKDFRGRPVIGDISKASRWKVTPGLGTISEDGYFIAGNEPKEGKLEVWVGEARRMAKITVGTALQIVDGFEDEKEWIYASYPKGDVKGSFLISPKARYKGGNGGILKYRFTSDPGVQAAYAKVNYEKILGKPRKLELMVKGDGSEQHIRIAYIDGKGLRNTLPLAEHFKSRKWEKVEVEFPQETVYPVNLESIYVLKERNADIPLKGYIYIDTLLGHYKY